jgi:hypothetical protein
VILLFVFPHIARLEGAYHCDQALAEMGFHEHVAWTGFDLQSSQSSPP